MVMRMASVGEVDQAVTTPSREAWEVLLAQAVAVVKQVVPQVVQVLASSIIPALRQQEAQSQPTHTTR